MSTSLKRGRQLNQTAVAYAIHQRRERIKYLLSKDRLSLTFKERHEAQRLTERWDFWNYELPILS